MEVRRFSLGVGYLSLLFRLAVVFVFCKAYGDFKELEELIFVKQKGSFVVE